MGLKVRYRGSSSAIGVLDALLRDEGLVVEHREVVGPHVAQQDLVDVVLYVTEPNSDVGADVGADVTPEPTMISKVELAIDKLRATVPRAQAEIVATRAAPPPTRP